MHFLLPFSLHIKGKVAVPWLNCLAFDMWHHRKQHFVFMEYSLFSPSYATVEDKIPSWLIYCDSSCFSETIPRAHYANLATYMWEGQPCKADLYPIFLLEQKLCLYLTDKCKYLLVLKQINLPLFFILAQQSIVQVHVIFLGDCHLVIYTLDKIYTSASAHSQMFIHKNKITEITMTWHFLILLIKLTRIGPEDTNKIYLIRSCRTQNQKPCLQNLA